CAGAGLHAGLGARDGVSGGDVGGIGAPLGRHVAAPPNSSSRRRPSMVQHLAGGKMDPGLRRDDGIEARANEGGQNFLYAFLRSTIGWRCDIWNLTSSSRASMSRSCWLSGSLRSGGTVTQPLMLRSNTAARPSSYPRWMSSSQLRSSQPIISIYLRRNGVSRL